MDALLACTKCDLKFDLDSDYPRCHACSEPLEVHYANIDKPQIGKGTSIFERYRDFLPFEKVNRAISMGEGNTPLIQSQIAGKTLGIGSLFYKNESINPTWSFKDRGTATGLAHALSLGFQKIGTVSTGNMATSVAAYGSRSRLETYILVSKGMPAEKLAPIAIYHPHLIVVNGDYGDLYYKSLEIGKTSGIYFINSDVPFRVEGSKAIAFEICEQLNFDMPDYVVVPVSAGGNLRGIVKGFEEFYQAGLVDRIPTMVAGQASGCSPVVNAFKRGENLISRVKEPHTIAHAIENPMPPSGNQMLRKLNKIGGLAVRVTDRQIIAAQHLMAREGLFVQPAAAVPLAVVQKLVAKRQIENDCSIVCVVTGGGLKYTAALDKFSFKPREIDIADIESEFERIACKKGSE